MISREGRGGTRRPLTNEENEKSPELAGVVPDALDVGEDLFSFFPLSARDGWAFLVILI